MEEWRGKKSSSPTPRAPSPWTPSSRRGARRRALLRRQRTHKNPRAVRSASESDDGGERAGENLETHDRASSPCRRKRGERKHVGGRRRARVHRHSPAHVKRERSTHTTKRSRTAQIGWKNKNENKVVPFVGSRSRGVGCAGGMGRGAEGAKERAPSASATARAELWNTGGSAHTDRLDRSRIQKHAARVLDHNTASQEARLASTPGTEERKRTTKATPSQSFCSGRLTKQGGKDSHARTHTHT